MEKAGVELQCLRCFCKPNTRLWGRVGTADRDVTHRIPAYSLTPRLRLLMNQVFKWDKPFQKELPVPPKTASKLPTGTENGSSRVMTGTGCCHVVGTPTPLHLRLGSVCLFGLSFLCSHFWTCVCLCDKGWVIFRHKAGWTDADQMQEEGQ